MATLTLVRGETATIQVGGHTNPDPSVTALITPTRRLPELGADHDRACQAAAMPDAATQIHDDARRTALRLGLNPDDQQVMARLLDYARGCYVHGHMDATADQRALTAPGPLATVLTLRGGAS